MCIIKVTNIKIVYCLENNCLVNLVCSQGKMLWHMKWNWVGEKQFRYHHIQSIFHLQCLNSLCHHLPQGSPSMRSQTRGTNIRYRNLVTNLSGSIVTCIQFACCRLFAVGKQSDRGTNLKNNSFLSWITNLCTRWKIDSCFSRAELTVKKIISRHSWHQQFLISYSYNKAVGCCW